LDSSKDYNDIKNVVIDELSNVSNTENNVNGVDLNNIENVICNFACNVNTSSKGFNNHYCIYAVESIISSNPKTVTQAKKSKDWVFWKEAMDAELKAIEDNNTWTIVERPNNKPVITSTWVLRTKENMDGNVMFKARLCARGYEQNRDFDINEIFAPVVNLNTVRIVIAISVQLGYFISQSDVSNAFLYGEISEDIYLEIPEGMNEVDKSEFVLKLNRSLYGLKQAPKTWNNLLNDFLMSIGLERSEMDQCLYFGRINGSVIYLVVYVDDILFSSPNVETINFMKNKLAERFKIKQLSGVNSFLGINIDYDKDNGRLKMNQTKLIEKIVNRFNVQDCATVKTPIEKNLSLSSNKDNTKVTSKPYKPLLGCLMYVMLATRPDLCFSVSYFGQFQNCPTDEHYNYLNRVLKYLKSSASLDLIYQRNESICNNIAEIFCDADWANCVETRRSVSGSCFLLYNNPILWKSRKQTLITLSSTESEFISLCETVTDVLWLRNLMLELGLGLQLSIVIREDNQSTIKLIKRNMWIAKRSKHIDVKYKFVKENFENGIIDIQYVPTEEQVADIFTKSLDRIKFGRLVKLLKLEPDL
jgi:hypothetical protein